MLEPQYLLGDTSEGTGSLSGGGYAHYWKGLQSTQNMQQGNHRVISSMQGGHLIVEIPLSDDLLTNFCKRSRRRFVEIQNATQAQLKLDRVRGCLRVAGTEQSIAAVHKHLEGLVGPRIHVGAGVWAELMRTRTLMDSSKAAVAHLQETSGCRIHIERSRQEVRLFGSSASVKIAEKILEELALECEEVLVPAPAEILERSTEVLESLAHACAVTFRLDASEGVTVLGTKASVRRAVEELRRHVADPQNCLVNRSHDMPKPASAESSPKQPLGMVTSKMPPAASEELGQKRQPRVQRQQPKQRSQQPQFLQNLQQQQLHELQHDLHQLQQQLQHIQPGEQHLNGHNRQALESSFSQWGQQVQPQQPQEHSHSHSSAPSHSHSSAPSESCCRTCPTCGAGRFCGSCGELIWTQTPMLPPPRPAMSLADWAMFNAASRLSEASSEDRGGSQSRMTSELDYSAPPSWPQEMYTGSCGNLQGQF